MNTTRKGDVAEAQILAALVRAGETVLIPFGNNERYDLALDRQGQLVRIQCKMGRYRDGVVIFNVYSSSRAGRKSYRDDVELFAVYCSDLDKIYVVPADDVGTTTIFLRVRPSRNKQEKAIRWASDYELITPP